MSMTDGIGLVVTDLDGTLWDGQEVVHAETLAAVRRLDAELGVPLLVATGRRRDATREPLARHGLAPPAVVLSGAAGVDLATGREWHREAFTPAQVAVVLDAFRDAGLSPVAYVEDAGASTLLEADTSTHPEHVRRLTPTAERGVRLEEALVGRAPLSFGLMAGPEDALAAVAAAVTDVAEAHLDADRMYGGCSIMVQPRGVSKWRAVEAWRGLHDVRGGVLAIGDGVNDLELLAGADVAVAVDDGHPEALALADVVVPPAAAGGWARLLELL